MNGVFVATYVLLWFVVLTFGIALVVALRQLGILSLRLGPQGALDIDSGPKVGSVAPEFEEPDLSGYRLRSPWKDAQRSLFVFVSPTCSACPQVLPSVKAVRRAEGKKTAIVIVSNRPSDKNADYQQIAGAPLMVSEELSTKFAITATPYAVVVDEQGIVRAKGIVNQIEHIEALLGQLDVGSDAPAHRPHDLEGQRTNPLTLADANEAKLEVVLMSTWALAASFTLAVLAGFSGGWSP
jgi:methylamine dehydrogenase accessory protein MauD